MFAAGLLIGMSLGVLLTIVGTVWLGSLADEGGNRLMIRSQTRVVKRYPKAHCESQKAWRSGNTDLPKRMTLRDQDYTQSVSSRDS
jgi:hypothetical protein